MTPIHVKPPEPEARTYGPRTLPEEDRRCACGRPIKGSKRRHVCDRCRVQVSRGCTPDGPCAVCGEEDLRVLGRHELADGEVTLCANDKAIAGRLRLTLEELRVEAQRGAAAAA
jgi:hypothetical protein